MKKDDLKFLDDILKNRDPKIDAFKKIDIWKKEYNKELEDYTYIHKLEDFEKMSKGGVIKIISLKDEKLKKGGVILDIKKNNKNKWYVLVGITNRNILWKIYFDDNYIFFREPYTVFKNNKNSIRFNSFFDNFVPKNELGKYTKEMEPNKLVDRLWNEYKNK
jgi:hypothetical protein